APARLHREVLLARRVTHPNVCRVFDLYEAGPGGGPHGALVLTMELLRGETLASMLARRGPISTVEALPLARPMAEAPGAAHRASVVHRDFKSANVVLVPLGGGQTRVAVTDFGLARALDGDDGASSRSAPLVGTCAYMSPEQVAGGPVGASADIYALGVVLYEIVTGRRPFHAETALATALQRMHEPPPAPTRYVPGLDPRWEAVILRCLARDPQARFARPEDVAAALEAATPSTAPSRPRPRSRTSRAAVAVLVVAGALTPSHGTSPRAWPAEAAAVSASGGAESTPRARAGVAVLGLANLSGRPDAAWLSTALAEMLRTELSRASSLRAIPGENVARMKIDLALGDA